MRLRGERVEQLVHARHGQRAHVEHLGLAALEQARTVRRRQHADLGRHRTQVGDATAVDAHALVDDAVADELLGQRADGLLDLLLATGELAGRVGGAAQLGDGRGRRRRRWRRCARPWPAIVIGPASSLGGDALDGGEHVVGVVDDRRELERRDRPVGGDHAGHELALQGDRLLDPHLAGLEPAGEHALVDLRRALGVVGEALLGAAGLDHHDGDVAVVELTSGDDELERARRRPRRRSGGGSTRRRCE